MDRIYYPGFPGLFTACIFSGALRWDIVGHLFAQCTLRVKNQTKIVIAKMRNLKNWHRKNHLMVVDGWWTERIEWGVSWMILGIIANRIKDRVQKNVKPLNTKHFATRSTGTVHTSAKTRLTSVAIRIRIRIQIRDPDRHQNLIICSLAHCRRSMQIGLSCKSIGEFLRKVADKQTDKQRRKQPPWRGK